ncbi:MAG: hypothetical protein ACFCBU_15425, partial [Cyanophyceae cyanobacterium]
ATPKLSTFPGLTSSPLPLKVTYGAVAAIDVWSVANSRGFWGICLGIYRIFFEHLYRRARVVMAK